MKYERWNLNDKFPTISVISNLGEAGKVDVEMRAILNTYEINILNHSEKEIALLKEEHQITKDQAFTIPEEELAKRKDLRKEVIFTVDPADAKDLDDAISIKSLEDGTFEIGVHIADVSHFVTKDSHFDVEASKRSNSIYFPNKVYSMLPAVLSEELCSLNPGEDKLAFSVFIKVDA